MKTTNRLLGLILFVIIISGCGKPPMELKPVVDDPPPPPCALRNYGTVIFENINTRNLMLYMRYNTEKYIEARSSVPITKITAGNYQYRYKELGTRKQKGGVVTFDVCACETTYVTLPSKKYYSCGIAP